MKAFGVLLLSLIVSNAHVSWNLTKCSNSDGTVTWSHGTDESEINLKYANFVEGTLTLQMEQVLIQMSNVTNLTQKSVKECSYQAHRKAFAAKVKIVASEKNPEVLRGQFPENQIETEVICSTVTYDPQNCIED
jgi:hypothetical protein